MTKVCLVIPARMESERFPNKLLAHYHGKPILEHIVNASEDISHVLVKNKIKTLKVLAIDVNNLDNRQFDVREYCDDNDIQYFPMTQRVLCGSERVRYVAEKYPGYDYYITIPADEAAINGTHVGESIIEVVNQKDGNSVYTMYCNFYCKEDITDSRSCKLVIGADNSILYTSRSVVPGKKDGNLHDINLYAKHLGVFIFPKRLLKKHPNMWRHANYSQFESLEQNMYLNQSFGFKAVKTIHSGFGIDTPDQLEKLEARFKHNKR